MQFFKMSDFECKCDLGEKCTAVKMDMTTVLKLDGLRTELGESLKISSGARCEYHNNKIGGADSSWHLFGKAVDVGAKDGRQKGRIIRAAIKHGFTGIGIPKGKFVHLDTRPGDLVIFGY